jgi:hypothetical protein
MSYRIFKRKPYRRTGWGYASDPHARCTTIRRGVATEEEAREICSHGPANMALKEGREYRHLSFYEFTRE